MQEKILFTKNLKLATALATLGIPFRKSEPFVVIEDSDRGNQREVTFFFEDTHDGKGTRIVQAWEGGWDKITNPEDPLAYIRATLENRERLLDAMNNAVPLVKKIFGNLILLISKNASPDLKRRISKYL